MALSGIQILKLLPKTNCKDCGVPTCLAFAMGLAQGKTSLEKCPHVSDEAKAALSVAAEPPIRTISMGAPGNMVKIGGETVQYRHEKTFVNKPGIAVLVSDDETDDSVAGKIARFNEFKYDRVGLTLRGEMIAIRGTDKDKFAALVKKVVDETDAAPILMGDAEVIAAGAENLGDRKALLYAATADNADAMVEIAKKHKMPLAVRGDGLEATTALADKIAAGGFKDLVLDTGARKMRQALEDQITIRRGALQKNKIKGTGFPTIAFPNEMTDDLRYEGMLASLFVAKYAGVVVLSDNPGHLLFPLLLSRLNIYTDPQRPMKTEEGVYEIGKPTADSPVLVTSNFSLTYFIVSGEIETSRVPAWLVVQDTEGLSVLTAWAAGKFVGDALGMLIKKIGIADKINHKDVVIPGMAAMISGDLEEELGSDWTVKVGPREASHIPAYLRQAQ